jgi:glutamyl-Q tRNA(Asp) synthetase
MRRDRAQTPYVGRFAPSPTGELHFGSLLAAVGSYLQARSNGGKWLLRIEDIDPPREVPGSAERIIADLQRLGLIPDETVLLQSTRLEVYFGASRILQREGKAFRCTCSRRDLPPSGIYPGTCREGSISNSKRKSVRIRVGQNEIWFNDEVMGPVHQHLGNAVGDFVIERSGGLPAYHLAVVMDDAMQEITEVVRGADLLDSTPRQIFLQKSLGLPTPGYLHLPVATTPRGDKLSKRYRSDPINRTDPATAVESALRFLGHAPPPNLQLDALWAWSIENWNTESIPRLAAMPVSDHILPGA